MTQKKQYPSIEVLKTAVEALKKMDELENKWQPTFDEMFNGSWCIPSYYDVPRHAICEMIEQIFDDQPDNYGSHFSWWVYEAEYGTKKGIADSMRDTDGTPIPMATIEDLYNYYISR